MPHPSQELLDSAEALEELLHYAELELDLSHPMSGLVLGLGLHSGDAMLQSSQPCASATVAVSPFSLHSIHPSGSDRSTFLSRSCARSCKVRSLQRKSGKTWKNSLRNQTGMLKLSPTRLDSNSQRVPLHRLSSSTVEDSHLKHSQRSKMHTLCVLEQ